MQENQDILVDWITQDVGFRNGIPIVACTIYKCLSHWNAFQSERTNIFDRLAQTIGACIEVKLSGSSIIYISYYMNLVWVQDIRRTSWSYYFVHILIPHNSFLHLQAQERNDVLSYWLSNVSTLLHLGHHYMKPREAPSTPITPNTPRRLGLLSRMTNVRHLKCLFNCLWFHCLNILF